MYMGKVFFSSGEIVVNGSRDAGVSNDNHDNLEAIFEKRHAFKAFFRRLVKEIFSRNSCRSGSTICLSYVLHALAATFRADADIHFPDCF
jgi:polyribonucleotide nucleotidyltransferase